MDADLVIAVCAIIVAVISLCCSIYFGWAAKDHNRRMVKPLPYIAPSNYENNISVRLWNYGTGPLIIKKVVAEHVSNGELGHLIDLVPDAPKKVYYKNFVKANPGRSILPGEKIDLLEFAVDLSNADSVSYRDALRNTLGNIEIEVEYTDVYDTSFSVIKKDLEWFHRISSGKELPKSITVE